MGFHLISSNRVEQLTALLALQLQQDPLSNPFEPELLIVPSMPMKRWLGLQLAQISGINCNIDYPLPAAWLWQLVSAHIADAPKVDPLSRDMAIWQVFSLLEHYLDTPAFAELNTYLEGDDQGIKRWQLSERIADVFDRYQYYRPELIKAWSAGSGDDWQARLWRGLVGQVGGSRHRLAIVETFLLKLERGEVTGLPERISIFAVSTLPPLLLHLIQRVAQHTDIYLYYLTPTDQYWADLKNKKMLAKSRLDHPDEAVYFETGHELLASWGKQGQVFQDLLCADETLESLTSAPYVRDWPDTLLGNLQRDLFAVEMPERECVGEEGDTDNSLEVHICHSPMRECQVLHDALLRRISSDSSLKPEDILVMVPEISRYAPYIEAVFSKNTEARPFIPWNLSDISVADEHPVILTFLQLLSLPTSRFTRSEIESLLDVPEICNRFELASDDIAEIRALLDSVRVRWGVDSQHRAELGLVSNIENSWKQAEQRLLAGYAMGAGELWHGIAPVDMDAGRMDVMSRFWSLFDRLNRWRKALQSPRTALEWQSDLCRMLDELFIEGSSEGERLQEIRNALADLSEQAGQSKLTLALVRQWLAEVLAQRPGASHYFSGGVTFCGMQPMRSLPFRHICLLGMQDAAFPSREHPLEFDRMLNHPRVYDPRKGEADRYLMLETLLCARECLYISYTGRSIRDNSECQPSVLVSELLDMLRQCYGNARVEKMIHLHPMQPFSDANYTDHDAYDAYWCRLATAIKSGITPVSENRNNWPVGVLTLADDTCQEVELGRLLQFAKDPVKFFVNKIMKIYFDEEEHVSDDEPFTLDSLQNWEVRDRLIHDFLRGIETDGSHLKAEGLLPHGSAADLTIAEQQGLITPMFEEIQPFQSLKPEARSVNIMLTPDASNQVNLSGQVSGYYSGHGLLRVSVSNMKGKNILPLWIEHLVLCAAGELPQGEISRFIYTKDKQKQEIRFPWFAATEARGYLIPYISAFLQGMTRPLPVFQGASWAYAESLKATAEKSPDQTPDEAKALAAAKKAWESSWKQSGDIYNEYVQLIMRGMDGNPVEDGEFADWSKQFYQSMLDHWSKS